jgi:hypothetical protein
MSRAIKTVNQGADDPQVLQADGTFGASLEIKAFSLALLKEHLLFFGLGVSWFYRLYINSPSWQRVIGELPKASILERIPWLCVAMPIGHHWAFFVHVLYQKIFDPPWALCFLQIPVRTLGLPFAVLAK